MANLIAYQDGTVHGSTTFKGVAAGANASMATVSSSTNTTTSYVYSSAFTVTASQTLEGLLVYCQRLTTTGTVSVALSDNNGTSATREVTVDAADLPADPSWVFFKFGSTLAADGGTDYKVGVKGSSAGNAAFSRDGTAGNWARQIRISTTATMGATDSAWICDELTGQGAKSDITVTMSDTAGTDVGAFNIGQGGVLAFAAEASTNYLFRVSGNISVFGGGTFTIGTVATPIPRTSTATLSFDPASTVQYGLEVRAGGTFTAQGLSRTSGKNVTWCLLSADAAANATSLTVDTDTGWLDNDVIAVAPTGAYTEYEKGALNGAAGASSLTVDGFTGTAGGVLNAHKGTAPVQAEVVNLTRNVRITTQSSSYNCYLLFESTSTVDMDWVEMPRLGASGTANKRGIDAQTTTGSCSIEYCAAYDAGASPGYLLYVSGSAANNITARYNVSYATRGIYIAEATSGTAIEISYNTAIGSVYPFYLADIGGTFTGNRSAGAGALGFEVASAGEAGTLTDFVVHNCGYDGILVSGASSLTLDGCLVYHNNTTNTSGYYGIQTSASAALTLIDCNLFGNRRGNILLSAAAELTLDNSTLSGSTTYASPSGVIAGSGNAVTARSTTFRGTSGIYAAHSSNDISLPSPFIGTVRLDNCSLAASTEINDTTRLRGDSVIGSQKHDQSAGNHKAWKRYGTAATDTTIYKTASPSERLTPNSASARLESGPKLLAVASGTTKTVKVWVRESVSGDGTDYNGSRVRLRCRRSDADGITSEQTLATATSSSEGAFEELSATTPAVTADAVLELYVDCDGTAGWVNVDDWSVS